MADTENKRYAAYDKDRRRFVGPVCDTKAEAEKVAKDAAEKIRARKRKAPASFEVREV